MKAKNFFKDIFPFNNREDMPASLYIIKKLLAFFLILTVSTFVAEGVTIVGHLIAGYNPLMGEMLPLDVMQLIKYYGYALFIVITFIYCRVFEKRKPGSLGFNKKVYDYLAGGVLAVLLLAVIIGVCCLTGTMSFGGMVSGFDGLYIVLLLFGFVIQGAMEEVMCRGFLLTSLKKKMSLPLAILVSSTAFAIPHLPTVLSADPVFALVGVVNLYLVSAVFSLLFVLRSNIYIVCGLHSIWNFVLNGAIGLSVSGTESNANSLMKINVNAGNLLSGGAYGIEASIITTAVLTVAVAVFGIICYKRGEKNGL